MSRSGFIFLLLILTAADLAAQQVSVTRIDQMPDMPVAYQMRNWKSVALGYDSLVFNLNALGTYLPLIHLVDNTVNYPAHGSFVLQSYVGSDTASGEAINLLPAVLSGTLAGIDKANQNGRNWVLMCEEFFNRRPEEDVYLNHPVSSSGDDWWYETMPNIFFYELCDRYPGTGDFAHQFTTVADRWLQAVRAMGGSDTPWQIPGMDHRAWSLSTMTANNAGVHEPEAAGAIAWLLYQAYTVTGNEQYRIGAELAMEFLNGYATDPSYELQLPYGAYIAARMNAELGTQYNMPKIINWCFDVGPLRSWGAMVGTWGGYGCDGLIGEVSGSNNYAFAMNTFEQIGALVPMVRYDTRFARAIGKWVLNAGSAARLFYANGLPDQNQDGRSWTSVYDPSSVVAHEALRQSQLGQSPYATGDAVNGGWAATNLALYGSSHAGILAGIVDTTDVSAILRLNLLATDYFHRSAYPTYLYYNPYAAAKSVTVITGPGPHDIYDAARHEFLATGVSDSALVSIPADSAIVAVIVPASGTVTTHGDMRLINGVVVDYHAGVFVGNPAPRIKSLAPETDTLTMRDTIDVYCTAVDDDPDTVAYLWSASHGAILGAGPSIRWKPDTVGTDTVRCIVDDGHSNRDTAAIALVVVDTIFQRPVILDVRAHPGKLDLGASTTVTCYASDPLGLPLTYTWIAASGSVAGSDSSIAWTLPSVAGNYYITCRVSNGHTAPVVDSTGVEVRDFSQAQTGSLVAYYPFSGNVLDASGNGHNGTANGAILTTNRFGTPASACTFNGISDWIDVPNDPGLNFTNAVTVAFWMKTTSLPDHETYPISHGNWDNRWKVSLTNHHVRWTVKTTSGIKDLDSHSPVYTNTYVDVVAVFSGSDMELYLNGDLDNFTTFSGTLLTSPVDLSIGRNLPAVADYSYAGDLDEIRIYDYALSFPAIEMLHDLFTPVPFPAGAPVPTAYDLKQNFPNPFNPSTTINFDLPKESHVRLAVYDLLGRQVAVLRDGEMTAGRYSVRWDGSGFSSGVYYCRLDAGSHSFTKKMCLMK